MEQIIVMRIEICGGIASGKTTLTHAIDKITTFHGVYEDFLTNTFLDDFYSNPDIYCYETEMSFLLQHMHQIKKKMQYTSGLICDFSCEQDFAYAQNNLSARAMKSFQLMYDEVYREISQPDVIIFLKCPFHVLKDRITVRNRKNEQDIDILYLEKTVRQLEQRISITDIPVIEIDSDYWDFREQSEVYDVLTLYLKDILLL